MAYRDRAAAEPVDVDLSAIRLEMTDASLAGSEPAPLHVSARIATGDAEAGTLDYRGRLAWRPQLRTSGTVDAMRIPVHAFEPYYAASLNVDLSRVDTSFKGEVAFAGAPDGPKVDVDGDVTVENLRALSVAAAAGSKPGTDGGGRRRSGRRHASPARNCSTSRHSTCAA